jgi:hypothetical protein
MADKTLIDIRLKAGTVVHLGGVPVVLIATTLAGVHDAANLDTLTKVAPGAVLGGGAGERLTSHVPKDVYDAAMAEAGETKGKKR